MNSLSTRLEAFIDDPRVRIAGPVFALVVTVALLIFGNVAGGANAVSKMKAVSVLPDQPLNLGGAVRPEVQDGAAAILAWQNLPSAKTAPVKPAAAPVAKAKSKKAALARR